MEGINVYCFLCRVDISLYQSTSVKFEPEVEVGQSSPLPSVQSLQHLFRYLKINPRNFENATPQLEKNLEPLDSVRKEQWKFKVELCGACAHVNENFAELYNQLEKIEMGLVNCLELIQLRVAENVPEPISPLGRENALRTDILEKCSYKLSRTIPRIKVRNLSYQEVNATKDKIKLNSIKISRDEDYSHKNMDCYTEQGTEVENIKTENSTELNPTESSEDENVHFIKANEVKHKEEPEAVELIGNLQDDIENSSEVEETLPGGGPQPKNQKPTSTINPENGKRICSICSKEFSSATTFLTHAKSVHLKFKHPCPQCPKQFSQRFTLTRHRQSAHMHVRFSCPNCNKSFNFKEGLMKHQRLAICQEASPNQETVNCQQCKKTFPGVYYLKRHYQAVHLQLRVHDCDVCGMKFKRKYTLQQHKLKLHPGGYSVKVISGMPEFTSSRSGSDDSNNPASRVVDTAISPKSEVETGSTIDSFILPDDGSEQFEACQPNAVPGKLESSRSGSGKMENECGLCLRKFATEKLLRRHHRKLHVEGRHKCTVCGKAFLQAISLRRHHQNLHNEIG